MTHHRVWKINEGLVRSLRPACSGGINKRTTPPPTIPKFDSLLVDPLLLWNFIIMPSFWWIFCCCWINLFLLILPSLGLIRQTKQCTTLSTSLLLGPIKRPTPLTQEGFPIVQNSLTKCSQRKPLYYYLGQASNFLSSVLGWYDPYVHLTF